ncbi:hypothetical protein T265_14045, partial [Opisthorchis viverrini]
MLVFCLFSTWTLTFAGLVKGFESARKIRFLTSTVPYIFLLILLIRGATLPGAWIGVETGFKPKWSDLLKLEVWSSAAIQVLFAVGPAWGGVITMASYNKHDRPLFRDVFVVPLACFFVSLFAGATALTVMGHQMHVGGVNAIQRLRHYGPGISFIVYSEALVKIPCAAICSVFFFAMLYVLGLSS